jgi:hypothetical protein
MMVRWTRQPIQDCTSTEQHPGMHLNGAKPWLRAPEGPGEPSRTGCEGKNQAGLTPTQQPRGMAAGRLHCPLVAWRFC